MRMWGLKRLISTRIRYIQSKCGVNAVHSDPVPGMDPADIYSLRMYIHKLRCQWDERIAGVDGPRTSDVRKIMRGIVKESPSSIHGAELDRVLGSWFSGMYASPNSMCRHSGIRTSNFVIFSACQPRL